MLGFAGCTEADDHFFLRDSGDCDLYGLYSDGFHLLYEACVSEGMSGNLGKKPGLLFVR
ncbi:MAG: hypothetical protein QM765_25825 [Myxococcales bacterium]